MNNADDGCQVRRLFQQAVGIVACLDIPSRMATVAIREPGTQS